MVTMQLDQELLRQNSDVPDPFNPTAEVAEFDSQDVILSNEHEFDPLWKRRNIERPSAPDTSEKTAQLQ